jgi:hypothetical protein
MRTQAHTHTMVRDKINGKISTMIEKVFFESLFKKIRGV